ncbi:c-type cytochrome [Arhodomonas sp. SL1]|uniref:c-type cytochrome n=1 Tax=Arhodomonas sp. SL1 TaxID=3425691 RepID=UPI003F883561
MSMRAWSVAGVTLAAALSTAGAAAGPQADYALECAGCHLMDGSGMAPAVPDMRGIIGRMAETREGRAYLVQVPGAALAPLDDARLAEVMNWTLRQFSAETLPEAFEPYTAEEVGRLRAEPVEHPERVRRELVRRLGGADSPGG